MPSQGIVVNILAKIEGWLELIKLILNAMKNLQPGANISKVLGKELEQVSSMINSIGKTMNNRLTSDSLITNFVDKMKEVEHMFSNLGNTMTGVSLGDLSPEYLTLNFLQLITAIELANTALETGLLNSFLSAIGSSLTLLNMFKELKIDPSLMNFDLLKEILEGHDFKLKNELEEAWKNADKLASKVSELDKLKKALEAKNNALGTDSMVTAMGIIGPMQVNGTILDEASIKAKRDEIRDNLMNLGIKDSDINKVIPSVDTLLRKGEWDKLPALIAELVRKAKLEVENQLKFNERDSTSAKAARKAARSAAMSMAHKAGRADAAVQELNGKVANLMALDTRAQREALERSTLELTNSSLNLFLKLSETLLNNSAQGLADANAKALLYATALDRVKAGEQALGKLQGVIQRWFSIYAVIRMVSNAIKLAALNIQELDKTMTEIAIVTKMDLGDLWQLMPLYTLMAREYASSIKGVYEVSQIYYQQGLLMNEVMDLTESTLKMARISGLGYSEAADYMTNAIRSFKMEMSEATRVVDVYSAVAASSASNVTELATAMSKTASSAQAVGSSFESTTAMLAVMIEATRESPENIGSAMKSIISRYGELKENKVGIDEEGESYSLNKVDTALLSVGISIHDVAGEFRDFDDVIFELAEHWNEIDKNTQRYIATVMAGNRQQSRFLALVSSSDRLKEEREKAENSEDASQLQFLKTLDSIDAKKQLLETSILSIYTNSGVLNLYKGLLDFSNLVLISFDLLSSKNGLGAAVTKIGTTFVTLATLVTNAFALVKARMAVSGAEIAAQAAANNAKLLADKAQQIAAEQLMDEERKNKAIETEEYIAEKKRAIQARSSANSLKELAKLKAKKVGVGMIASTIGLGLTTHAASLDVNKDREKKALMTGLGGVLSGIGTGAMIGGIPGIIMGALTAIPSILEAIGLASESVAEKVTRLLKNVDDTKNEKIKAKDDLKTLSDYRNKYEELRKTLFDSAEKLKEFLDLLNEIAEKYPSLIQYINEEGNAVVNMVSAYTTLAEVKQNAYTKAFSENLGAELGALKDIDYVLLSIYGINPLKNKKGLFGSNKNTQEKFPTYFLESLQDNKTNGHLYYQADTGRLMYGDQGFNHLVTDNKIGNLSTIFTLDEGETYQNLLGYLENIFHNNVIKTLLGKIYGIYEEGIINGTAYEDIDVSSRMEDLLNASIAETIPYDAEAKEYFNNTEYGLERKNSILDIIKDVKMTSENYKIWENTAAANKYQEESMNRLISTRASELINTLGDTYDSELEFNTNNFLKYAITKDLEDQIKGLWNDRNLYLNNDKYQYLDDEGNPLKYTEDNIERLISDYLSGGITGSDGKEIAVNGIHANKASYENSLKEYSYLDDSLNEFYINLGKNSFNLIRQNLTEYIPNEQSEEFKTAALLLESAFTELYEAIIKRYKNWAEESLKNTVSNTETRDIISQFSDIFGPEYLLGIQDQYKTILNNKKLTDLGKNTLIEQLTSVISSINTLGFAPELLNIILQKMLNADFSSLFGIYNFLNNIKDAGVNLDSGAGNTLKNKLAEFGQLLNTNITTEIDNYIDSLTSASEGMETDLSSATGGMNIKNAREMADKLGKNLNDFIIRDGKFYYENLNDIVTYYDKSDADYEQALSDAINLKKDNYKAFKSKFGEVDITLWKNNKAAQTALFDEYGIDYTELSAYYEQFKTQLNTDGGITDFYEYIEQELSTALANGTKAIKDWATLQKSISLLKTVGFDHFWESAGLKEFDAAKSEVLHAAMTLNFESLKDNEALYQALLPYIDTLGSFFKESKTSILNEVSKMFEDGTSKSIKVTDANRDYLLLLASKGLIKKSANSNWEDRDLIVEAITEDENAWWQEIASVTESLKERITAFKDLHKNKYSTNRLSTLLGMTEETITYDNFIDYMDLLYDFSMMEDPKKFIDDAAKIYGLSMTLSGDYIVTDWTKNILRLTTDLNNLINTGFTEGGRVATFLDINAARIAVEKAKLTQEEIKKLTALDLLTNYSDISLELLEAFANAIGTDMLNVSDLYITNTVTGKTQLNLNNFRNRISAFSEQTRIVLEEEFSKIIDEELDSIINATNLVTKGTTKLADITKFITEAKEVGLEVSENIFSYDELLNAWTLDATTLYNYVLALAQTLIDAGLLTTQLAKDYINNNVNKVLANEIDVSQFFKAEYLGTDGLSYLKLYKLLNNYINLLDDSLIEASIQSLEDNKIVKRLLLPWEPTDDSATKLTKAYIEMLSQGGENAVTAMYAIMEAQGKEVQSADILAAYTSELEKIEPAFELLAYGEGSLISGAAKQIIASLEEAGYEIQELDDNNAVILLIGDISQAYQAYYNLLLATGEATLASLNEAMAKVYETKGGRDKEQIAIDMLDKAMGMTYTEFGEILSNLGISMTEDLMTQLEESLIISSIGGNLMRILDFNALATSLNWDFNSETYLKALKAYNDSYISFTEEKLQQLMDEISALKDARGGSKINLTQYMHNLEQAWQEAAEVLAEQIIDTTAETLKLEHRSIHNGAKANNELPKQFYNLVLEARHKILNGFEATLSKYGASLNNGILTLEDNANLLGIATTLLTYAQDAGIELEGQLAELSDTITSILQSFVDILNKGIEGTLTATEALNLKNLASGFGINNISFDKTAEGLKLSETSAIRLYYALKEVDGLQATLVFDKLKTSLELTNEHFRSSTSLMGHIKELETEIEKLRTATNDTDDKVSKARLQLYEAELAAAKEILAVRAGTEDSSFNFMSNKIPGAQNNPINYYNNWADALHKVRDALNTKSSTHTGPGGKRVMNLGLIDYQDWYNIVTEMGNLAEKSGEIKLSADWVLKNSEDAAKLIEASAAALTVDSNGLVKVALGNIAGLGMDFQTGATDMAKSIDTGIKAVAKSLVDMLNGIISMLELIVAMEQLGDIDIEGNGIDFSDIFEFKNTDDKNADNWYEHIEGLSDKFNKGRAKVLAMLNEELKDALKHTRFNLFGKDNSLYDLLDSTKDLDALFPDFQGAPPETKKAIAESYTNFIKGMYEMALSGDWDDLENLIGGFQKQLAQHGLDMSLLSYDVFDKSGKNVIRTVTFAGTTQIEIDWEDPNVDDAVKRKLNESNKNNKSKPTTIDEVRAAFVKASKAYAEGKGATEGFTIEELVRINHKTKFETKTDKKGKITSYEIDGKTVDAQTYYKSVAELALKDVGATINENETKYTAGNKSATAEGSIIINKDKGIKAIIKLDKNGKMHYELLDDNGNPLAKGDNLKDTYHNFYNAYVQEELDKQENQGKSREEINLLSEELYLYKQIGINYIVEPTFKDKAGNPIQSDSAAVLKAIREWIDQKQGTELTEGQDYTIEGDTLTVTLKNGVTLDLLASKYSVNGDIDSDALFKDISAMYNSSLVENISAGITAALKDGIELKVSKDTTVEDLEAILSAIDDLKQENPVQITVEDNGTIEAILSAIDNIQDGTAYVHVHEIYHPDPNKPSDTTGNFRTDRLKDAVSTGTIGLAKAQGTLMGELGPELVVSNGHYFVAGLNGPEMVDLADDAIVFNHLQTKSLLEKGMSRGRGQAVTNERNAVSFATGNVNGGPAMASASAALAALKQLRAQWQALAGMSAQDLAGKGGGGGGGGGDPKAFIKELERWYNYLQKIALLEKEISLEEAKRTTYASSFSRTGKDYYTSLVKSLQKLKEQLATLIALNTEQEAYFNKRRDELNKNSAFKALYSFDENGQLKYDQDKKYTNKNGEAVSAFEWLSDLAGRDSVTGEANYSAEEQYNKLVAMGYADQMKFDSSGNEIKQEGADWYATAVQAFWDKIEAERQEMQELHDSVEDGKLKSQELQNLQNEILLEIEDNLIAVELKVLKAVEESRQRLIDELLELRDAIEESSNKLIDGLSDQLSKEQQMYDNQLQSDELAKLQRLLQILQRSGGSASLIADLQSLIAEKLLDMYFEMQLQLIDALQEASDNLLERLDHLIDIMTELLAYEKENGLLWNAVYEVLLGNPEDIATYIEENASEYWGKSPTDLAQTLRKDLFEIDRFKEQQKDISEGVDLLKLVYGEEVAQLEQEQKRKENEDYIRGLYKDLLGREAGDEEVAGWAEKMAQGMSAEDVKKGFLESNEYRKKHADEYVASLYKELLGREGSAQEIKSWADLIRNGSKSIDEVRLGFLDSAEYQKKNGATNSTKSNTTDNLDHGTYYTVTGSSYRYTNRSTAENVAAQKTRTDPKHQTYKVTEHKFQDGGLEYDTGLAWLDGTKNKPEAVLNPEQTRILRNNILSSRPDSLVSLLKSYNEAYHGLSASTYDSISNNNNNSTIIERAEVNLLVAQLANDYDSKRAANTIMDEMLRIASKTGATNSVRR